MLNKNTSKTKIKKSIIIALIVSVFLFGANSAYNVLAHTNQSDKINEVEKEINEQEEKIKKLKEKAKKYQGLISSKQLQISTLEEQMYILDSRINKKAIDIKITEEEIDQTMDKIVKKNIEIRDKEGEIINQKEKITDFIRLIYKNDQKSYLEILILNDSFSDFFNYLTFTETIEHELKDVLDEVITLKDNLEKDKDLLEREKRNLEKLNKKLTHEKSTLDEEKSMKKTILRETRGSETLFKKLLNKAKQEQVNADRDILILEKKKRKLLEQKEYKKNEVLDDSSSLSWPVSPSRGITALFHDPDYPYRHVFEHSGIDIRVSQGTPIRAPANGYIGRARNAGMGYSYIMLIHDNGISTVYGHVSKILVEDDQFVTRGQIIGRTGGAPGTPGAGRFTTGAHLHLEVRLNGIPVNPLNYLNY